MNQETVDFKDTLISEFEKIRNQDIAIQQEAYMKGQFKFLGIKAPLRREILQPFFVKSYLPPREALVEIVQSLWEMPEREYQMTAQDLAFKYKNQVEKKDIELYEYMITHKSWWDTVDFIAIKLVGNYLKKYPQNIDSNIEKWINSDNIWLRRTAILFQLKYKNEINPSLLDYILKSQLGSKEFFINKAIGWMLREYSKTNPDWVTNFVHNNQLSNLSKREAIRLMKK